MSDREINGAEWIIPAARAKNGEEHTLPLSEAARDVLAGVDRIYSKSGLIFTTTGASPVSGFTRAKERLDRLMIEVASEGQPVDVELPPFTLHDLRRTTATGMAGLGFPPHVVEAVLNHRSGTRRGVAGVYNRFDYASEKRAALEAWSRSVLALVNGHADNVVPMGVGR